MTCHDVNNETKEKKRFKMVATLTLLGLVVR